MSRGRGQEDRRSLEQSLGFSAPRSLPVTAAPSSVRNSPAVTATRSTTLFNAVASRAANVAGRHSVFTGRHLTAEKTSAPSGSSPTSSFATMAPCKVGSTSSSGANTTVSPKVTKKFPAVPEVSQSTRQACTPSTFDSDVSDTHPETTASDTTAPSVLTAPETTDFSMPTKTSGAAPVYQVECATIYTPDESYKSVRKSTAAREKTKKTRPKPGKAVSESVPNT